MLAEDVRVCDSVFAERAADAVDAERPLCDVNSEAGLVDRKVRYEETYADMQDAIRDLWGPPDSYSECEEDRAGLLSRFYYFWVTKNILLASRERLTESQLPQPTRDVRAHDCGFVFSRAMQRAAYVRNAWNSLIGTDVRSCLDGNSRGVLRWVGTPQQGGYTKLMAAVEWAVAPAYHVAAASEDPEHSPFFDGVVHGETLFTPTNPNVSTLEDTLVLELVHAPRDTELGSAIPTPKRPSTIRELFGALPQYFWWQFPFKGIGDVCTLLVPVLLQQFVLYLKNAESTWAGGLGLVAVLFFVQAIQSSFLHHFYYISIKCGLQYRSALTAAIFEKCFLISSKSLANPSMNSGRIINMVSTDVEKANDFVQYCMYLWSSPLVFVIAIILLAKLVGWCSLLAVVALLTALPVNAWIMKWQMSARTKLVKAMDARVKATNEYFSGVRIAKFMTWEPRFLANIEEKREVEIFYLKQVQTCRILMSFVNNATPLIMIAAVFVAYYVTGHEITDTIVFPAISLLGIIRMPFGMIPFVFQSAIQFVVSMRRITEFLECENASCDSVEDIESLYANGDGRSSSLGACDTAALLERVDVTAFVPVKLPFAPSFHVPLMSRILRYVCCCDACRPVVKRPCPRTVEEELAASSPTASSPTGAAPSAKAHGSAGGGASALPKREAFYQLEAKELLSHVDLHIPRGKLTVVLGPTGSGKSTLLQALLGQFEITEGRVWCSRNIAYVPQQAWIMNATVRDNVLFFDAEDDARLKNAIRVSQLGPDLELLAGGLEAEIGEKGVNLSGGQKARVSLARAVYADRDMYLLDDPLSALDAHVGERVVTECVLGTLAGKTRVLATHQMHVVPRADYIVVLGEHSVRYQGDVQSFTQSALYRELSSKEENEAREKAADADEKTKEAEAQTEGLLDQGQSTVTAARPKSAAANDDDADDADGGADGNGAGSTLIVQEEKAKGGVPLATYLTYFGYCGGTGVAVFAFAIFVATELLTVSSSVWLSAWSTMRYPLEVTTYLKVYLVLVLLGTCSVPLRYTVSYTAMRRGCVNMHKALLRSVSRGTMEFFDRTPLGRLLNRFSRDIDQIDNGLQMSMISALECFLVICSSMLVMIISQPIVIVALIPCGYVYYRLMVFFNTANREIRRTSSIMKTPVYTLLGELTNGSATIAAYEKSSSVMQEALRRLDMVLSCCNLEGAVNRWLAARIDLLSYLVVASIAFAGVVSTVRSRGTNDIGLASLAVTMAMQVTGILNWFVVQIAAIEADMNSVERIQYYVDKIPKEESPEIDAEVDELERRVGLDKEEVMESGQLDAPGSPLASAPNDMRPGSLVFDHVQMRYREGLPLVLRDVCFRIAPREKVGIVGRTGSGKSTLLLTFMRMVDVSGGSIDVNGAPIRSYGLRELRKLFSMIPQDPVLFDGTVRLNVDPFLESSTEEVWSALDMVGLRERVESESEGVDARVQEGGANFSVGQRQLLCMARALLKKGSGFILMDEATANIDPALDRHIQKTVMRAFDEYTVITIAHRLQTVAQYDTIIVMDHGVVAEMGSPRELVGRSDSIFRSMVESMGAKEARAFSASLRSA